MLDPLNRLEDRESAPDLVWLGYPSLTVGALKAGPGHGAWHPMSPKDCLSKKVKIVSNRRRSSTYYDQTVYGN